MLIYRHDASSGLHQYVSIWASFRIFLLQSNIFLDSFDLVGQHGIIFLLQSNNRE